MKTVQNIKTGEILRCPDDEAYRLVTVKQLLGPYKYVHKNLWKIYVRDVKKTLDSDPKV